MITYCTRRATGKPAAPHSGARGAIQPVHTCALRHRCAGGGRCTGLPIVIHLCIRHEDCLRDRFRARSDTRTGCGTQYTRTDCGTQFTRTGCGIKTRGLAAGLDTRGQYVPRPRAAGVYELVRGESARACAGRECRLTSGEAAGTGVGGTRSGPAGRQAAPCRSIHSSLGDQNPPQRSGIPHGVVHTARPHCQLYDLWGVVGRAA